MMLVMTRGDTKVLTFFINTNSGILTLSTGDFLRMTIKDKINGSVVLQKVIDCQAQKEDGSLNIVINPEDTENMDIVREKSFVWDVELRLSNGYTRTFYNNSILKILADVTTPNDRGVSYG